MKISVDLSAQQIRALDALADYQRRTRNEVLQETVDYYFGLEPRRPDEEPVAEAV